MAHRLLWQNKVTIGEWGAASGHEPVIDQYGTAWTLGELDGWFDGVPIRANTVERFGRDGLRAGRPLLAGRVIEMSGTFRAVDPAGLQESMDLVERVLSGYVREGLVTVNEIGRGLSRQASVTLNADTKTRPVGPYRGEWAISLLAKDPARYSTELFSQTTQRFSSGGGRAYDLTFPRTYGPGGSSGLLSINNLSTKRAWPIIRLTGPLVNPVVNIVGGSYVGLNMTVGAGEVIVIDMKAPLVQLNGATRVEYLSLGSRYFSLPEGPSQVYFSATSGTGTATVEWRTAT